MPWAPRRPCPAPGCRRRLGPGERCPEHTAPREPFATSTYRSRRAIPEKLRRQILQRDEFRCVVCGAPANVVDHIIPRAEGGSDDPDQLQSLCTYHSRRKTGAEGARAARRAREGDRPAPHIAITGYAASGKSELAKRLSAATGIPTMHIDDLEGNWRLLGYHAHRHAGPLIVESIALPAWPLALLIYCRCDESLRQRRLRQRPGFYHRDTPERYDHSARADLVVDTTRRVDLRPVLRRIDAALSALLAAR